MGVETFNLVVSITLIILTMVVLAALFLVIRTTIRVNRFVAKLEEQAEKIYIHALSFERKAAVNAWFWPRFIRSVVSSDFVRSVFWDSSNRRG